MSDALYDFEVETLAGERTSMNAYRGKVLLIVNVASNCGFTPQYAGLQHLHDTLCDQGFTVLGFPCNQFGGQEPGTKEEIGAFCKKNYGVTFPMHAKVNVNGRDAHPLYRFLRREQGGIITSAIKWNFTKFLVDSEGKVVKRFGPQTKPAALLDSARELLPAVIQSA
ncbi:MAG: glutathione peroxidase [Myxococcota bacterium]